MTDADRTDLDACGFTHDDIRTIEGCLSPRPQWVEAGPTCPGTWIQRWDDNHYEIKHVLDPESEPMDRYWFGPIPEQRFSEEGVNES